ncbi:MarR family winged helix-turn-helix transcriptional regulator [Terrabacter sp. NPDC000476]|uniref:MarR family winged helix-turn-helix transcriptional regulator n=1 Tax=Terrabacter sp. NPDC000476 TaxID=3154258 RepID=UPI00331E616D
MAVSPDEANDLFLGLLRVQKLLVAAKHAAPRLEEGVDVAAYPVLFVVAGAGTVRISELATTLHNDVSTVSRQVSALVTSGMLDKSADPSDGRALVVSLTERGRTVLDQIQTNRSRWFQGLLAEWEPDATAEFVTRLRELGDALDANLRARGATTPPMPFDSTRDQKQKED